MRPKSRATARDTTDRRSQVRAAHLQRLWRAYLDYPTARQADKWLAAYFRANKSYGKRDRRYYSEAFFHLLRTAITALPIAKALDAATAWQALRQADGIPTTCSQLTKIAKLSQQSVHAAGLPQSWYDWLLHSSLPQEKILHFLRCLAEKPPLYLRLNFPEQLDSVVQELKRSGFSLKVIQHDARWITLSVEGELPLYELAGYRQGLFEIQDLASQYLGAALDAHPGMAVWDVCAGGGGKTLQIAAQMQNRGVLYASDIRDYKLDELRLRARRAGFHNIRRFFYDAERELVLSPELKNSGGFHRILVDAPCSASGTLRRNPDVRFRIMPGDIEKFAALQLKILRAACRYLRSGGKLVYATCSIFRAENENVVQAFLSQNTDFRLIESRWVGAPTLDSDTMFYAILLKK